jgi:hypothetical protein
MPRRQNPSGTRAILDDESEAAVIRDEVTYMNKKEPGHANPRRTGKSPGRDVWPNRRRSNRRSGGASSGA